MNGLLLVAASGLARETLAAVRAGGRDDILGIVDDDPGRWGTDIHGVPVLGGLDGTADMVASHPEAGVVVCAGKGAVRERIVARLDLPAERYATVVHPSVDIPASCSVGAGSVLLAGVVLTADVRLGRHVVAMPNVTLTHDDVVADYATLCAGVALGGSVRIGARAYLGMNAAVRENRQVGADAVIGMGAVLLDDAGAGEVWVGNPARPRPVRVAEAG